MQCREARRSQAKSLSNFGNEDQVFGLDAVPFIANAYADAKKLWQLRKPATDARLNKQGLRVRYSSTWQPGGSIA